MGAVISGDFAGWNTGLMYGGFWGLAIATFLMAVMYVCIVFTIAELSAALPHAGGFFSFTRNALGPTGGFICGLTDPIEYVITPAVIVYYIGGYMDKLVAGVPGLESVPSFIWWLLLLCYFCRRQYPGLVVSQQYDSPPKAPKLSPSISIRKRDKNPLNKLKPAVVRRCLLRPRFLKGTIVSGWVPLPKSRLAK